MFDERTHYRCGGTVGWYVAESKVVMNTDLNLRLLMNSQTVLRVPTPETVYYCDRCGRKWSESVTISSGEAS